MTLLSACSAPPQSGGRGQTSAEEVSPPVWDGPLRTDRSAYIAERGRRYGRHEYTFTVIAQYTNRTGVPVYLDRCFPDSPQPTYGVPLVGATEPLESAYEPAWSCVGHDDWIVVQPGAVRVDTLRISGPTVWDGRTGEIRGKLAGRFRLVYLARSCPQDIGCPLPDSRVASNEFEVRIQR